MPINFKGKNRTKKMGISSGLKRQLQADVWSEERHKTSNKLYDVRIRAEKVSGDAAVRAYIKKKKWEKYNKDTNPHGQSYYDTQKRKKDAAKKKAKALAALSKKYKR